MTITVRSADPGGWSKIPHTLARDPRLSNGARGLAVQMLSHADGFRSDEEFLAQFTADSRNAVRKQLAELRQFGYLVRERVRGDDGKLTTRSVLYDTPQPLEPAEPGNTVPPSRRMSASRSDQGRFEKTGQQPAAAPWRDGPTSTNTEKTQVTPTRHTPAGRSDQGEQNEPAGRTDSPYPGVHIEDQREEQKKISQSAYRQQAIRALAKTYGLTDDEALLAANTAEARAKKPVANLAAYIASMAEGDMAAIVEAIQLRDQQPPAELESEESSPKRGTFERTQLCTKHRDAPEDPRPIGDSRCLLCNQSQRIAKRTALEPEQPEPLVAIQSGADARAAVRAATSTALAKGRITGRSPKPPVVDIKPQLDDDAFARQEANIRRWNPGTRDLEEDAASA